MSIAITNTDHYQNIADSIRYSKDGTRYESDLITAKKEIEQDNEIFETISEAIQSKTEQSEPYDKNDMADAITAIETGEEVLFSSNGRQYTRRVVLPDGVTTIGKYVFENCKGLTEIDLKNVTTIDEMAFENCKGLTEIDLKNVTIIKTAAFRNCSALQEIKNADFTTLNGSYHFSGAGLIKINCRNLTSTLHSFYVCHALRTAILPNVITLGQNTFLGDSQLLAVDCRNVNRIVQGVFQSTPRLHLIDLTSRTTPTILDNINAFTGSSSTWIAVVTDDAIRTDFQNATNWSTFADHFKTIAEVEAEVGMTYDEYYYQLFGVPRFEEEVTE